MRSLSFPPQHTHSRCSVVLMTDRRGGGAGERGPEQLLLTPTLGLSEPAQTQLGAKGTSPPVVSDEV